MEQRKLIAHGLSSLTVALPMKWLKERALKKGDSVYIDIEGNQLILNTKESISMDKMSVNITKLDRTSLLLYIQSLYRFGYNEIEVTFDNPITKHYRKGEEVSVSAAIHKIVNRCIGAEVIEQSENRILIKYIGKEEGEDFKAILRRAFLLINETAESLVEGMKKKDMNLLGTIEEKHDNINKFVTYCLRLLNKYGYPDVKQTCFYYHIIASMDKIVDILKYTAREVMKYNKKFNKETIAIWEQINKSIKGYYELFYKFDFEIVNELSRNRDEVKYMIKKEIKNIPNEELLHLTSMKQILEIILDLTDCRMGLEY